MKMSERSGFRPTQELLGVLGVGVTLVGLVVLVRLDLRGDMRELRQATRAVPEQIRATETELRNDMGEDHQTLRSDMRRVEEEINSIS